MSFFLYFFGYFLYKFRPIQKKIEIIAIFKLALTGLNTHEAIKK